MAIAAVREAPPGIVAHAMQREPLEARRILGPPRENHAALAGDYVLGHIKAETAEIADGPNRAAVIAAFDGMGAVLDHSQVMMLRQGHQGAHIAGTARKMHRQDGARARGDARRHRGRIEVEGHGIHIGEHGCRTGMEDRIDRRAERQWRRDDLITRRQTRREQTQMQGCGTGVDRHCLLDALVGSEIALEAGHLGPRSQPAATQAVHHLVNFGLADERRPESQETFTHPKTPYLTVRPCRTTPLPRLAGRSSDRTADFGVSDSRDRIAASPAHRPRYHHSGS